MARVNHLVLGTLTNRLVLLFLALQVLDALTTMIGLRFGAVENNPLAASYFSYLGNAFGPSSLKIMGALVMVAILARVQAIRPQARLHWNVLLACNLLFGLVVLNNLAIIAGIAFV